MVKDLDYIREHTSGKLFPGSDGTRVIDGIVSDSRAAGEGKLFLGLRGEKINGNSFAGSAVAAGGCALVDDEDFFGKNCVLVGDVRKALLDLASYYRRNEVANVRFVGVTGSVGKTTTKDMIACALASEKMVHKTSGNANSQVGLPTTVIDTSPEDDFAVVELGMSYPGEMERIARAAMPDISVVTNIGHSHIENLGSREAIRDEKLKIASASPEGSVLLLNGDEPLLRDIDKNGKRVFYLSTNDNRCDCFATDISSGREGTVFTAHIFGKTQEVSLNVIGAHFILNALFALAVCELSGVSLQKAASALNGYKSDGRRQFIYESCGHTVISDCYNAAPESVSASLSVLGGMKGRRIAVLGDMLELGERSPEYHAGLGSAINKNADVLVTYGELARHYADNVSVETHFFKPGDPERLKNFLNGFIKPGDIVLYKASNGMKLFDCIV